MSHIPPARRAPRAASRWPRPRAGLLILGLLVALLAPAGAAPAAGNAAVAGITDIDLSAFPQISALVAVSDTQGNRVPGLPADAFGLDENGIPVTLSQVSEEQIGLEIAFVIESSAVFSKRDPSALTRLDYVKTAIINFAAGNGHAYMKDSLDDVSLLTPEGPLLTHTVVGGEIRNALISYQSQFKFDTGLFDLIRQAMDTVSAGGPRPGVRRIVVLFSSGIDPTADAEVAAVTARAAAEGITGTAAVNADAHALVGRVVGVFQGPVGAQHTVVVAGIENPVGHLRVGGEGGGHQLLIAPDARPATKNRWNSRNRTRTGSSEKKDPMMSSS